MKDLSVVIEELKLILSKVSKKVDITTIESTFKDVIDLFGGKYPGYRACNTQYHDIYHTLDTVLAMARLIHANHLNGQVYDKHSICLAIVAGLLHDTGYIQKVEDQDGTGAKYTACHVERSIQFTKVYCQKKNFTQLDIRKMVSMISCTGLDVNLDTIKFSSKKVKRLGQILGSADFLGQMADRTYLEKLLFLFYEFQEGNIPGYKDEQELLVKTLEFAESTKKRYITELGGVNKLMIMHFRDRFNINEDLYQTAIDHHLHYLKEVVLKDPHANHRAHFKRDNLVKKLQEIHKKIK
ncbi:MAG: hypothetical protein ISR65_07305 [Bacteriovoracaceae bacterium]|nr:hypothetical protein [Bacteriovoracaceae bacterium]